MTHATFRSTPPTHWTFRTPRLPDELLSSWLTRAAHAHGAGPHSFCAIHYPGFEVWARDIDRSASNDLVALIAASSRNAIRDVEAATLASIADGFAPHSRAPISGNTSLVLSSGLYHRTRTLHGLQYCPRCLESGAAYFQRTWRIGFVVACPEHGVVLKDSCPACDAPLAPHRAPIGLIRRCHACESDLVETEIIEADEETLAFQQMLLRRVAGNPGGALDPWALAPFTTLRTLLAVTTARPVLRTLSRHFGLPDIPEPSVRMEFETSRVGIRSAWLALIATWTAEWPAQFVEAAAEAGLTRQSFSRHCCPPALAAAVNRLATGQKRNRPPWSSILNDATMRRLRRKDRSAWRALHARRALVGRAVPLEES